MAVPLAVLLLPFLQLGLSFYASVSTLAAALCLAAATGLRGFLTLRIFACLFVVWAMLATAALHPLADSHDLLRAGREALCFLMIIALLRRKIVLNPHQARLALHCLGLVALGLALLVIAQTIGLQRGVFVSLPHDLYVINTNTLPTDLDLRHSRVRPSGPFGEPSYLAAVATVLVLALSPLWPVSALARGIILVLALATFLSLSMLGLVSMSAALALILLRHGDRRQGLLFVTMLAVGAAGAALAGGEISERIGAILRGEDFSFASRIAAPLLALPRVLGEAPFGIPIRVFLDMGYLPGMDLANESFSHNAIFNTLINYGVIGMAMLAVLFLSARGGIPWAILFVLLMQNGAFWSFDKVSLLAVSVILHRMALGQISVSNKAQRFVNRPLPKLVHNASAPENGRGKHADIASDSDGGSGLWRPDRRDFRHYPLPGRTGT